MPSYDANISQGGTTPRPAQAQNGTSPAFIHSKLDELKLTPVQFRVYCHATRRAGGADGMYFESVPNCARHCKIRIPTARKAIAKLVDLGLLKLLAQYELSHIEAFMYHSPRRRSEERKSAALSRPDAETTKKLVDEATIAANPHFGDLRAVKCAELTEQYDSIVRPAEIELLNAAISHLEGLKSAATESVAALSSEIGVELSLKDVCKKFDGHISTLAQIKGRLTDPPAIAARTDVGGNVPHPAQSPTASFWGLAIP